jgi:hypothetical protein
VGINNNEVNNNTKCDNRDLRNVGFLERLVLTRGITRSLRYPDLTHIMALK